MSILISHVKEYDYSTKVRHNKFFYGYICILGSFILMQIYSLSVFYDHSFHKEHGTNVMVFHPINDTDHYSKDLHIRHVKHKPYYVLSDYHATYVFNIIERDIHSSLVINIFTFISMIYIYKNYHTMFFKIVFLDKFSITRSKFIRFIAFLSYIVNVSYGAFINELPYINKLEVKADGMVFFMKSIYYYYYVKWISFLVFISVLTGSFITLLIYKYVFKNMKSILNKSS